MNFRTFSHSALAIAALAISHAAMGTPDCEKTIQPIPVLENQGRLEALAFDSIGKLYISDLSNDKIIGLDSKDGALSTVVDPIKDPGGLAFGANGELYAGSGNGPGGIFPLFPQAKIFSIDVRSGVKTPFAVRLTMANGVLRTNDGVLFSSNSLARSLDRVNLDGTVEVGWLKLNSNGMALSNDGKTLFVNRSVPSRVMAVNLETKEVQGYSKVSFASSSSLFDGLAIDDKDQLYVAAYLAGKILKVRTDGSLCTLARGMSLVSDLAFGINPQGSDNGFSENSLFATSHNGVLYELADVLP